MSQLLDIVDWFAAAILVLGAAHIGRSAWAERHDRDAWVIGVSIAGLLALIALRLVFK